MTSLQSFPEEVLQNVFNKLHHHDLQQCQKVCRSWYFPAHVILLRNIKVDNPIDFKRFINSINHNPDPYYLNAVQKFTFGSLFTIGDPSINQSCPELFDLIARFPNLKSVVVYGSATHFDSPLVKLEYDQQAAILTSCRKLEKFDVFVEFEVEEDYFDFLYDLRHTLTFMGISRLDPDTLEEYLGKFPHIETIRGTSCHLDSYVSLLRLVEKLPALKDISFGHDGDHGAAIAYLASKPKNERDLIVERLSKFTYINPHQGVTPFCVDAASIIVQYFTGLRSLELYSQHNTHWDDKKTKAFCKLLEYARNLEKFDIAVDGSSLNGLSMCIEHAIRMFRSYQTNKRIQTYLELYLLDEDEEGDCDFELKGIIDVFKHVSTLDHIDIFSFSVSRINELVKEYYSEYNDVFETITRRMLPLKELSLTVPTVLSEDIDLGEIPVTTLALRVDEDVLTKDALKDCISMLKLEHLQLFYFSGVWHEDLYEFHINLGFCNLEKLSADLTPVKRKMKGWNKNTFIVIEVKFHSNSKRRLFKIPLNYINPTEINDASLEGLEIGRDYLTVRITINTLQCLDIFAQRMLYYNYYEKRNSEDIRYANLFNNEDVHT